MKTYEEFINSILESRGRFGCGEEYHERHHIIPKCMGGTNDKENLIDLFAREHFEAHKLLAFENQDNESLIYAWGCMAFVKTSNQKRYELSPEEYEEVRVAIIEAMNGRIISEETRQKMKDNHWDCSGENHPMYGKHHSEESKNKISNSKIGLKASEETKQKMSESQKTRWTDELREEWSQKMSGGNNPMFGKHHTSESRKKQSDNHWDCSGKNNPMYGVHRFGEDNPNYGNKWTEGQRKRHSDKMRGKFIGENNPNYGNYWTEDQKNKQSEIMKDKFSGSNNPRARKVIRLSDFKIYDCGIYAAEDNNISYSTLRKYCKFHKYFMHYDEWLIEQNG